MLAVRHSDDSAAGILVGLATADGDLQPVVGLHHVVHVEGDELGPAGHHRQTEDQHQPVTLTDQRAQRT